MPGSDSTPKQCCGNRTAAVLDYTCCKLRCPIAAAVSCVHQLLMLRPESAHSMMCCLARQADLQAAARACGGRAPAWQASPGGWGRELTKQCSSRHNSRTTRVKKKQQKQVGIMFERQHWQILCRRVVIWAELSEKSK